MRSWENSGREELASSRAGGGCGIRPPCCERVVPLLLHLLLSRNLGKLLFALRELVLPELFLGPLQYGVKTSQVLLCRVHSTCLLKHTAFSVGFQLAPGDMLPGRFKKQALQLANFTVNLSHQSLSQPVQSSAWCTSAPAAGGPPSRPPPTLRHLRLRPQRIQPGGAPNRGLRFGGSGFRGLAV